MINRVNILSPYERILAPELTTSFVFLSFQLNSWASFFLPQGIPHHSDRLHGQFIVHILTLDTNNTVLIINIFIRIFLPNSSIFFLNLFFRVKNNIQILRFPQELLWHAFSWKPLSEHFQFFRSPWFISWFQKTFCLLVYRRCGGRHVCEILNEKMFAEGSVAIFQPGSILVVEISHFGSEFFCIVVYLEITCSCLELSKSEIVEHYAQFVWLHH